MLHVTILNTLVVLTALMARFGRPGVWLKLSFALVFLFLALRYDYGNDYNSYLAGFIDINRKTSVQYFGIPRSLEPGWLFLCRVFAPVGFFGLVIFLALINTVAYYLLFKKFIPPSHYWFAMFIYVFTPSLMLIQSSAMRQTLAVNIFLLAIGFIYNRRFLRYLICMVAAAMVHMSAIALIPLYLFAYIKTKMRFLPAFLLFSAFILAFILGDQLRSLLSSVVAEHFDRYMVYTGTTGKLGTGLGIIIYAALLVVIIVHESRQRDEARLLFKIAMLAYLILPLGVVIMMAARYTMYFLPATIVALSLTITTTRHAAIKVGVMATILALTMYSFYSFFQSSVWSPYFGTYQTIFSSARWR